MLLPVFAMRREHDFGIGDTLAVKESIDFCARHHLAVLQFLPIHETVGDHSPYNPISAHALSPGLITIAEGEVPGLTREMIDAAAPVPWLERLRAGPVKYNSVQPLKQQILLRAHDVFISSTRGGGMDSLPAEFEEFKTRHERWLLPYTLFRLLVREYEGNTNWGEWRPEHQSFESAEGWIARHPDRIHLEEHRDGLAFVQWVAWRQWCSVRDYACERGVVLMGEMSFGVGRCSADVWFQPDLFDLEWSVGSRPIVYFDTNKDSERWGQNWGLPAYRWENHRSTGYEWLRSRVSWEAEFFQACRLDHLRGYFRMYVFPWGGGAQHAEFAKLTDEEAMQKTGGRLPRFVPGPDDDPVLQKINDSQGRELISIIRQTAGGMYLVAEIMGAMPDYMSRALDDLHLANLTFPQLELGDDRSLKPPGEFRRQSLATYANHDHAPLAAFYLRLHQEMKLYPDGVAKTDMENILRWIGWAQPPPETLTAPLLEAFQRALLQTHCQLAVFMSSDVFGIPQRFNLPGSYGAGTWSERIGYPLAEYEKHPEFGPRIRALDRLIVACGRTVLAPGGACTTKPRRCGGSAASADNLYHVVESGRRMPDRNDAKPAARIGREF
jgi:4-alpha-glucanotransferase